MSAAGEKGGPVSAVWVLRANIEHLEARLARATDGEKDHLRAIIAEEQQKLDRLEDDPPSRG